MNLISLRIKSPYGYILNTKAVIPVFINKAIKKEEITLKGNVSNEHNFTFTEDIGSACRNIFKNPPIYSKEFLRVSQGRQLISNCLHGIIF